MSIEITYKNELVNAIQYNAPFYSNVVEFINSFGDDASKILIKVWGSPNEDKNISNISGIYHLVIRSLKGDMELYSGNWIIRTLAGEYFVLDKYFSS